LSFASEREPTGHGVARLSGPSATSALRLIKQVLEGVKLLSKLRALGFGRDEIDADVRFRFRRGELP
jgi:hypothetical protein